MDSPIVTRFTSEADKSGLDAFRKALRDFKDDAESAGKSASSLADNVDTVFSSRTRRAASTFIFRDIATSALMATGPTKGLGEAAQAAFLGVEILGRGALSLAGGWGIAIVAITAAIAIFEKLSSTSEKTAEQIKDETTKLSTSSIEAKNAANELQKYGLINNEVRDALLSNSKAERDKTLSEVKAVDATTRLSLASYEKQVAFLKEYEVVKKLYETGKTLTSDQTKTINTYVNLRDASVELTKAEKSRDEQLNKLKATTNALNILDDKKNNINTDEQYGKLEQTLLDIRLKQLEKSKDYNASLDLEKEYQAKLNQSVLDYTEALKTGDQQKITSTQKRMELDKQEYNSTVATNKSIEAADKQKAAVLGQIDQKIGDAFTATNGKILFNARSLMADEIKSFASMEAGKLELKAIESFASGNYVLGAEEAAGALAIRAGAGALAAAITAGGQSDTSTTGDTGGSSTSTTTDTTTGSTGTTAAAQTNTKLTIVVQGPNLVNEADLAKRIVELANTAVNTLGSRLGATSVVTAGGGGVY